MDLRLGDEQAALCAEADELAADLRPLLGADSDRPGQGMLSDGDCREVTRTLGQKGGS